MNQAMASLLASASAQSAALAPTARAAAPMTRPAAPRAYVFDGTLECLLSAVFAASAAHDPNADIMREGVLQPRLDQEVRTVPTDFERALRVKRSLVRNHGIDAFDAVRAASASDDPTVGNAVYHFILHALAKRNACARCPRRPGCQRACECPTRSPILDDLGDPCVWPLTSLARAVMNERHKMTQFIRFQHREGDIWFARCNPNASVVPLLMDWFVPRFNTQRFAIYDENHRMTGLYDGSNWCLVAGDIADEPPAACEEAQMQDAWLTFYDSLSIEARYNPELRRSFMPRRLWKNLIEVEDRIPANRLSQVG